jgi:signal transduction histidine kinase
VDANLNYVQGYTEDLLDFVRLYDKHYPDPIPEIQAKANEIDIEFLQTDLSKLLNSMRVGTERINQIVLSLRNFSRMDEAEFKAVDIHDGLDSTLLILQHRLKATAKRAEIQIIRNYADLPLIECYAGQLNQVFMNILANAIDAIDEASDQQVQDDESFKMGCIQISTALNELQHESPWVKICISDNGSGIPQHIKQKIFEPFFTTKPTGKGTGMGMSISYQIIVEKHGGLLNCCSTAGAGTEFVIQIPVQQPIHDEIYK